MSNISMGRNLFAALVAALVSGSAFAQGVESRASAPWGSRTEGMLVLPSARLLEAGSWEVALTLSNENDVVRAEVPVANPRGGAQSAPASWIGSRGLANLQFTASPLTRLELYAGLPVLLGQTVGAIPGVETPTGSSALGDAYAAARFALLEPVPAQQRGLQWTMQGGVNLPTGSEAAAFGEPGARFHAASTVTYDSGQAWLATGHFGYQTGSTLRFADQLFGDHLVAGAAGAYRYDAFQFSLEAITTVATAEALAQTTPQRGTLEFLAGARWSRSLFFVDAGAGVAPFDGGSTPRWRLMASLGARGLFEQRDANPDPDRDGVMGALDRCPTTPEDQDGFEDDDGCPDVDNDGDKVVDARDVCPLDPEDLDGVADHDGCPETDADGDGIADASDTCARAAEDFDGFEDADGCPEAGAPDGTAVFQRQTVRGEAVFFETGSTVLDPNSLVTLRQVARILLRNEGILVVTGRADDRGEPVRNDELSLKRAEVVRNALLEAGIPTERIQTRAAGTREPISRSVGLGQSLNRSVTFDWAP